MFSIAHNPYRILGAFANDPVKVRTANVAKIRVLNRVGKECNFESDFIDIFGPVDRTSESIDKAISLLASESDAELYSYLWLHRTPEIDFSAKAPIDIIRSSIGKNGKSNLVNVAIGSLRADNLDLAAEAFVQLFECDDAPTDETKKKIIQILENGYKGEYDLPLSWWQRFRQTCSQNPHHESFDFIRKVYNEESVKYLREIIKRDVFKESADKLTSISVPHHIAKHVIEIARETSDLETNQPNAEVQIALSEYASVVLKACKRYYKNSRFWDAKPAEDLLVLLREIYRISYSCKTKDECTEFGKKVKADSQYLAPSQVRIQSVAIRKEIESFCEKPNETRWSLLLVKNTVAPLTAIKTSLGAGNLYYRRISTQIADNAIYVCQTELESAKRKVDNPRNDRDAALSNFKRISQQAKQLVVNLMLLDVEDDFATTKLKFFDDEIEKSMRAYGLILDKAVPTISLSTDDDLYKACTDYYTLVEFTRKYPNSPHFQDAIQRIWKIEDDEYPQIGTSISAYKRAFFTYKEKFPSSHNEQKILEKINQFFLQNTIGTVYDYRTILRLWPNHPQKALIVKRIDDAAFKQCSSISGWHGYLSDFPNGLHRKEALGLIAQAEEAEKANKEQKAFDECKTTADYNRFILNFPTSNLFDRACTRIEDLIWAETKRKGSFDQYLKQYPHGRYNQEAKRLIGQRLLQQREIEEKRAFEACKKSSDFKAYLKQYPNGKYQEIANAVVQRHKRKVTISVVVSALIVFCIVLFAVIPSGDKKDKGQEEINSLITPAEDISNTDAEIDNQTDEYYQEPEMDWSQNHLSTGERPYSDYYGRPLSGGNEFRFNTASGCDYVILIKKSSNGRYVDHKYVRGGENITITVPDGTYDVFFYSGNGWNPNKAVGSCTGGFETNESYQKDGPVTVTTTIRGDYYYNQTCDYTLYPVQNGNLHLESSNANEIFN